MKRLFYLFAVLVLAAGCGTRTGRPAAAASDDDAVTVQPADSALLSGEVFTDEELTEKSVNSGAEARGLLPGQNPVKLEGTDLLWISSSGFDMAGTKPRSV